MRRQYFNAIKNHSKTKSPIHQQLEFLRFYPGKNTFPPNALQHGILLKKPAATNQIDQQHWQNAPSMVNIYKWLLMQNLSHIARICKTISFQNACGNQDDSSILIEDSDSENEAVEMNDDYFELIVPDDNGTYTVSNRVTEPNANHCLRESLQVCESLDADGDKAFGRLIVEELRKMTPAAQQEFKRNVTQLLYT